MKYIDLKDDDLDHEADQEFYDAFNMDKFSLSMSVIKCVIVLIVAVSILLGFSLAHCWADEIVWLSSDNLNSGDYGDFNNGGSVYFDSKMFLDTYDMTISDLVNSSIYSKNALYCLGDYNGKRVVSYDNLSVGSGFVDLYTAAGGVVFYSTSNQPVIFNEYEWNSETKTFTLIGSSFHDVTLHPNGIWYYINLSPKIFFAGSDVGIFVNNSPFDTSLNTLNYNLNYGKAFTPSENVETSKNNLYFPQFRCDLVGNDIEPSRGSDYVCLLKFTPTLNNYQTKNILDFTMNIEAHLGGNYTFNNFGLETAYLSGDYYTSVPLNVFTQNEYINYYNLQFSRLIPFFGPAGLFQQKNVDSQNNSTLLFKNKVDINGGLTSETLNEAILTVNVYLTDKNNNSSNISTYTFNLLSGKAIVDNQITENPYPYEPSTPIEFPSNDTSDIVTGGGSAGNQLVNVTVNNNDFTPLDHFNMTNNSEVSNLFQDSYGALQEVKENNFLVACKEAFSLFPFDFWKPFITVFGIIVSLVVVRAVINILT